MRDARYAVLAAVMIGVACVVGAGCGGDEGGSGAGTSDKETVKVGLVMKQLNPYYQALKQGAEEAAEADPSIELDVDAGATDVDASAQVAKIQNMVTQGVDVLAVTPVGEEVQPALAQAVKQGVKVILVDNDLPTFDDKASYIGTDNYAGGAIAGEYLGKALKGKGKVGILIGIPGAPTAEARVDGAADALEKAGIEVVKTSQADECAEDTANSVTRNLLTAHADLNGIYAICGGSAAGMGRAVKQAGRSGIIRVGFDGDPNEAKSILAGNEDASVAQFPKKMGATAVQRAAEAARGEDIPKRIDTGTELVTEANAKTFLEYQ